MSWQQQFVFAFAFAFVFVPKADSGNKWACEQDGPQPQIVREHGADETIDREVQPHIALWELKGLNAYQVQEKAHGPQQHDIEEPHEAWYKPNKRGSSVARNQIKKMEEEEERQRAYEESPWGIPKKRRGFILFSSLMSFLSNTT